MAARRADRTRAAPRARRTPESGLLVGIHPVREALLARRRRLGRVLLRSGTSRGRAPMARVLAAAREAGVPVEELPAEVFDGRVPAELPSQGVALEAGPLPTLDLEDLTGKPAPAGDRVLVALDGVEDPQNLGAIARVADAAGAAGLVVPERRSAPLSAAASRASAGALEWLPAASVVNLPRSLRELKSQGFWIFGADPEGESDLYASPDRLFEGDRVLVLGAEGRGLRPGVRAALDARLRIPLAGHVASLNVSTAAALVLFEWRRRAGAAARS